MAENGRNQKGLDSLVGIPDWFADTNQKADITPKNAQDADSLSDGMYLLEKDIGNRMSSPISDLYKQAFAYRDLRGCKNVKELPRCEYTHKARTPDDLSERALSNFITQCKSEYKTKFATIIGWNAEVFIEKLTYGEYSVYSLCTVQDKIEHDPVYVFDTPDLFYISAAVNYLKSKFRNFHPKNSVPSKLVLEGKFKQELLERSKLSCPMQVDRLDLIGDKESIFNDCNFLEEVFTQEPAEGKTYAPKVVKKVLRKFRKLKKKEE